MADSPMDIIKSDPTEFAAKVSKISMTSGSLFAAGVVLGVIGISRGWTIDPWLLRIAAVGAIVLALASVGGHALDLLVRGSLTGILIREMGTSNPEAAMTKSEISGLVNKLMKDEMIHGVYLIRPGSLPPTTTDTRD